MFQTRGLNFLFTKINDESNKKFWCGKIIDNLSFMLSYNVINSFYFYYDLFFDNQVNFEISYIMTSKLYGKGMLELNTKPLLLQS